MFKTKGVEGAFSLEIVEDVAGLQVLLEARTAHTIGHRVGTGEVGVVEVAVELEHAQRLAQLPIVVQLKGQLGAQRLRLVVDKVAVIAIGGAALHVGRTPVHARDAAIRRAVEAAVLVLGQPVEAWRQLPADRGCEQLAVAGHVVAEAVAVLITHVQAQADVLSRVRTEVGVQAAHILAAALGLDAGAATGLGRLTDAVDDAALATAPIKHCSRALEHVDALDVVQVAYILAVVTHTIEIEIVTGIEAADAQAVEAGVRPATDVGDAAERGAQVVGAVVEHGGCFHRVDCLGHVANRRRGPRGGADFLDARAVGLRFTVGVNRCFRQQSRRRAGKTSGQ